MIEYSTKVLDKGFVKLIQHMGGDLAVVASARVSNGLVYEEASKGLDKDSKLIYYLMKHRHGTPFEHSVFTFYVKVPLFVAREWQRHRIGSYNEVSGRYTVFKPEFYIPNRMRTPAQNNKQGSVFIDDKEADDWFINKVQNATRKAFEEYEFLLNNGVAKELARIILPLNLYTEFYWTVNARSLMNFLNLRTGEDAQWEIRQFALAIKEIFKNKMPITFEAWEKNLCLAP